MRLPPLLCVLRSKDEKMSGVDVTVIRDVQSSIREVLPVEVRLNKSVVISCY